MSYEIKKASIPMLKTILAAPVAKTRKVKSNYAYIICRDGNMLVHKSKLKGLDSSDANRFRGMTCDEVEAYLEKKKVKSPRRPRRKTSIYWKDDGICEMIGAHRKDGIPGQGVVVVPTSPFKGVCNHCGSLTTVRHYPYSAADNSFGVFCDRCMKEIDEQMGAPDAREDADD